MKSIRSRMKTDSWETVQQAQILIVAVKLPTGAIEIISNTQELESKLNYYFNSYDENMKLKSNPDIQIVGYMLV